MEIVRSLMLWALVLSAACAGIANGQVTEKAKAAVDPKDLDIAVLEEKIIAARIAIKTGEFEINVDDNEPRGRTIHAYHTWIGSRDRARDERVTDKETYVALIDDERAYHYERAPGHLDNPDRTKRFAVETLPALQARDEHELLYQVSKPLLIMFAPCIYEILYHRHMADYIGSSEREKLEAIGSSWDGTPSVIVRFDTPRTGNHFEYEVVPSMGYNIVRWEVRGQNKGSKGTKLEFLVTQTCILQKISESIWFPEAVQYSQLYNGQLHTTDSLEIKVLSVNKPIDEKVFTLADVPPGVMLIEQSFSRDRDGNRDGRRAQPLIWDGERVRSVTRDDFEAMRSSQGATQPATHAKP